MTDPAPTRWQRAKPWVIRGLLIVASFIAARIIINLVGSVDWAAVGDALSRISALNFVVLLGLLLVRQSFNAIPLWRFVPGLTWPRSLQNDVAACLLGTVAPPPGDIVLRVAMFKSWRIDPVMGMAGVTLNMLAFYVIRFSVPVVGLLLVAFIELDANRIAPALISLLIAVAMMVALVLVARGDRFAAWIGRTGARVVGRFRDADQDDWANTVVDFRGRMDSTIKSGLPPSLAALLAMVISDGVILLFALRFVGVTSGQLSVLAVLSSFLLAYPLTMLPLFGLGVLDAALVATFVEIGGKAIEAEVIAGLIVWRVVTIAGPLLMGVGSVAWWRRHG